MNVFDAIAARRTIRDFSDRPVAKDIVLRILDAGLKAPSHDHLREWHFVLVEDAALRERLASFFRRTRTEDELREMLDGWGMEDASQVEMYLDAIPKQAKMLMTAGALIVPCFRQSEPLLAEKRSLQELNAFASIWAAVENVLVAAAAEGVFGVTKIISSPEERDHVRAALDIPENYEIPCYLALGHPAEDAVWHEQVPIVLDDRLHVDRWAVA